MSVGVTCDLYLQEEASRLQHARQEWSCFIFYLTWQREVMAQTTWATEWHFILLSLHWDKRKSPLFNVFTFFLFSQAGYCDLIFNTLTFFISLISSDDSFSVSPERYRDDIAKQVRTDSFDIHFNLSESFYQSTVYNRSICKGVLQWSKNQSLKLIFNPYNKLTITVPKHHVTSA
jgi:hypothetical protein